MSFEQSPHSRVPEQSPHLFKQYKTAVFIGRFQPFHRAHLRIVEKALEIAENVIISIGSARRPRTTKNPWSIAERKDLITLTLLDHFNGDESIMQRIVYSEVGDFMYDDTEWGAEVYVRALSLGATDDKKTVLIGAYKDDSSWYLKFFPQWDLMSVNLIPYNNEVLNATDIRKELYETKTLVKYKDTVSPRTLAELEKWAKTEKGDLVLEHFDWLRKYKDAHSFKDSNIKYRPSSQTGDTVVHRSGHILLIKRRFNPGRGLWALPGGFINDNERILDGALRELKEETKIDLDAQVLRDKIVHMEQFDHPRRSERGRIYTNAYLIDLGKGAFPRIKASDDAAGAKWVHIREIFSMEEEMFDDHYDIINRMIRYLK